MEHTHEYDDGSRQEPLPLEGFPFNEPEKPGPGISDEEFVAATRDKLQIQLDKLRRDNRTKFTELERMGATLTPHVVLLNRLDQLLDMVLTEDTRLGFELGFESRMADTLTATIAEVRAARLRAPMPPRSDGLPPGLVLPN